MNLLLRHVYRLLSVLSLQWQDCYSSVYYWGMLILSVLSWQWQDCYSSIYCWGSHILSVLSCQWRHCLLPMNCSANGAWCPQMSGRHIMDNNPVDLFQRHVYIVCLLLTMARLSIIRESFLMAFCSLSILVNGKIVCYLWFFVLLFFPRPDITVLADWA